MAEILYTKQIVTSWFFAQLRHTEDITIRMGSAQDFYIHTLKFKPYLDGQNLNTGWM